MGDMLSALAGFAKDNNFNTDEISKAKENRKKENHSKPYKNRENKSGTQSDKYVGAPYNFVSQWDVVEKSKEDCIRHNLLNDEYLSGEITYQLLFETEVMVGAEEFYRNPYGAYAIPGSTIRGLIRSHAQVLSLSSIADDIDDYALMYREVGGARDNPNKKIYGEILGSGQTNYHGKTVSILKNVKAGYIVKDGGKYKIFQTKIDKINQSLGAINYYIINERQVQKDKTHKSYPFFWNNTQCLQHDLRKEFERTVKKGRVQYKGEKNKEYKPYYKKITYRIEGERNVVYIGEGDAGGGVCGVIIGTGKMNEKKCHYIIPEIDRNKPAITLDQRDVDAFRIDYNHKKNQLQGSVGSDTSFFDLPKEGEVKPVFYIEKNGRTYFGYTPRLRLFYKNNIWDGLILSQKNARMDYAKALFGYSDQDDSYKTRLSFSDALLKEGKIADRRSVILGEPSASSYNDYLVTQDGSASTYNNDGFRLRGAKQYWLRDNVISSVEGKNKNVGTAFSPMDKGAVFEGKVRFHNLTESEVGLLLWCISLNPSSRLQIGKGKPYGYGRAKATISSIKELDAARAYDDKAFSISPFNRIDDQEKIDEYTEKKIGIFKKEINVKVNKLYKGARIDDLPSIKEFFAMRDASSIIDPNRIRYMRLDKSEYQNRKPLKDVFETLNG